LNHEYYDKCPLHSINGHHLGGPGGQGEGVQGGPLHVSDGPHASDKMLGLSKLKLETASYAYFLQCPIFNYL
jgi:hypothetical protein